MGRNAQPGAVKEAKGNPGRRPIAREGGAAPASALAAPKDLGARVKRLWNHIAPELGAMRILRGTDLGAFRRYVVLLDKWGEAERGLKTAKLVNVTSSEHVENLERRSQWLLAALMLDKRLTEIEDRFGMNPAARQRLMLQMAQAQPGLPLERTAPRGDDVAAPAPPAVQAEGMPASPVGLLLN